MKKLAIIIQARIGSTRLPGKVLADIEGKSMLWHTCSRLKLSKYSPEIIIATTNSEEDKKILKLAGILNLKSYSGSVDDVLDRYYQTALTFRVKIIARITADCPLIDPNVFDKVLETFLEGNYDYISNTIPPTFPDGLDVEVFTFEVLEKAWKEAKLNSEREHVTTYIWKHPEVFTIAYVLNDKDISYMRWTVDEEDDLQFVREIYKYLYSKEEIFLMDDIVELLKQKPELMKINSQYSRNEGYIKSLQKDKIPK